MKCIKVKNINKKIVYILIFLLFSAYYIGYCNIRMVELPHMTWFDQMALAENYFENRLEIQDLFSTYGEHGMLANNILFLINVTFFHGTTMFDVVINDLNVIICSVILMLLTLKTLGERGSIFWVIIEAVFLFSSTQASSGAMETQVRLGILFFLIAMLFVDKEIRNKEVKMLSVVVACLMIILSINVFGTLYSFAGVPLVWAITCFYIIERDKSVNNKKNILISIVYFLTIPIYILEYSLLRNNGLSQMSDTNGMYDLVEVIKSLCAWCANGVLGWAYHESIDYNTNTFLVIGAIVLLIVFLSVVLFMKKRMYEKTWVPLMCITYSFGVFVMILIGRASGWDWMANEWYNVHIKLALASSIWIYGYVFKNSVKSLAYISAVFSVGLTSLSVVGNIYEIQRTPYVRQYYLEKQKYLFVENANDMPVDENGQTPLLHSLEMTMDSIDILKKYRLSVFRYWDGYEAYQEEIGKKVVFLDGRYDDGWVENEVCFIFDTDNSSEIEVNYYSLKKQTIEVWVNGKIESEAIELNVGAGCFDIEVEPESKAYVEIRSNYYEQLAEPDNRYASFIISKIEGR